MLCCPGPGGGRAGAEAPGRDVDVLPSQATHLPLWVAHLYWLWFGLSRQREATGHSLNASSESKYLSAFQEENPPEENSMTEGFVPRGSDMDA